MQFLRTVHSSVKYFICVRCAVLSLLAVPPAPRASIAARAMLHMLALRARMEWEKAPPALPAVATVQTAIESRIPCLPHDGHAARRRVQKRSVSHANARVLHLLYSIIYTRPPAAAPRTPQSRGPLRRLSHLYLCHLVRPLVRHLLFSDNVENA